MKYLLDTCVISESIKPDSSPSVIDFLSKVNDRDLFISTMTLAEIHRGIYRLPNGKKKNRLMLWLNELEKSFADRVLSFDYEAAIEWAKICAQVEANGKTMSAFDSIIAAIASRNHMALVTRNVKDFKFTGLEIINPW